MAAFCAAALAAAGCSRHAEPGGAPPPSAPGGPAPAATAPADVAPSPASPASGEPRTAGGVRWAAPAAWKAAPDRPMRVATYLIPAAPGDSEGAECGVFYFGPGQGGGVESNFQRWLGQFVQPDGRASSDAAKRARITIDRLNVSTIDVSGTYLFSPTPMSAEKTPKPGYRMLGAIVEAPEGSVFFKLTGPAATAAAASGDFQALLQSIQHG